MSVDSQTYTANTQSFISQIDCPEIDCNFWNYTWDPTEDIIHSNNSFMFEWNHLLLNHYFDICLRKVSSSSKNRVHHKTLISQSTNVVIIIKNVSMIDVTAVKVTKYVSSLQFAYPVKLQLAPSSFNYRCIMVTLF